MCLLLKYCCCRLEPPISTLSAPRPHRLGTVTRKADYVKLNEPETPNSYIGRMQFSFLSFLVTIVPLAVGLKFDAQQIDFNLNQNPTATDPLAYSGEWQDHTFHPSPKNWRFPFYTLFLDRYVNGDPANDNANGTLFEHDISGNQLRHGGDLAGLIDSLDYIQGMGVKVRNVAFGKVPDILTKYRVFTLLEHHSSISHGNQISILYASMTPPDARI